MAKAREELEYIKDARGRKKAVILPISKYRRLMEDLHDLEVILARRDEPSSSIAEVEKLLRDDGLLPHRG
jgi:PHD/YefM family antitoxin component YafN of YafNO toxin-antitoxin module